MPELTKTLEKALESFECDSTPMPPDTICIRLPFGIKICSGRTSIFKYEGPDVILLNLLKHLQNMISPLMAILIIASIVKAIVDCIKAIPDAISSLSIGPIIECLQKLAKVLPQLFEYIPPFSYIPLLVDFVRAIIYFVDTLIEIIQLVLISARSAINFRVKVELLPGLGKYQGCIDDEVAALYQQIADALNASGPIFMVLAKMLDLINIGPLKKFVQPLVDVAEWMDDITAGNADTIDQQVIDKLEEVRTILREVDTALQPFHIGTGAPTTHEINLT
jgi:hypothetical protein